MSFYIECYCLAFLQLQPPCSSLYKQTIVVSSKDKFPVRFLNIFIDYPLGQMCVGDKLWMHWNEALLKLWQTQLNFAVWCALSTCGVSSAHLNYTKHPIIRAVYRFHVRRVLKRSQTPLRHVPVLMPLITLVLSQNFKKFVRIIGFLMIL